MSMGMENMHQWDKRSNKTNDCSDSRQTPRSDSDRQSRNNNSQSTKSSWENETPLSGRENNGNEISSIRSHRSGAAAATPQIGGSSRLYKDEDPFDEAHIDLKHSTLNP